MNKEQTFGCWMLDVQLVSPAYLNGSDGWKMERLQELRETMDDMSAGTAYVYSLEGGHIYTEDLGSGRSNLQRPRIIFSAASTSR